MADVRAEILKLKLYHDLCTKFLFICFLQTVLWKSPRMLPARGVKTDFKNEFHQSDNSLGKVRVFSLLHPLCQVSMEMVSSYKEMSNVETKLPSQEHKAYMWLLWCKCNFLRSKAWSQRLSCIFWWKVYDFIVSDVQFATVTLQGLWQLA